MINPGSPYPAPQPATKRPVLKIVLVSVVGVLILCLGVPLVVGGFFGGLPDPATTTTTMTAADQEPARPLAAPAISASTPSAQAAGASSATTPPGASPTPVLEVPTTPPTAAVRPPKARPTATARPTVTRPKPTATTKRPRPRPTTTRPEPRPTTEAPRSVYYKNCTAVRAAGADPIRRGDPGYAKHLDRDGDGVGCE